MSAPKPPDPAKTIAAQTESNQNTAVTQYLLGATNQVTPQGTLTYNQTGQNFVPSSTGQKYFYNPTTKEYSSSAPMTGTPTTSTKKVRNLYGKGDDAYRYETVSTQSADPAWQEVRGSLVPQMTATTAYSPEQLKLYQQQTQLGGKLNDLAIGQTDRLKGVLSQPIKMPDGTFRLGNEATESRLMELGRKRLDPLVASRNAATTSDLFNRGLRPGTEAYDKALRANSEQENDAYNQLLLTGREQAANESMSERQQRIQEALLPRNQSINEISALMSGGQVSQPTFQQTPQPGVSGTDVAGITNQAYQQQAAQQQSKMSGLLGLGTALGGWMFSERSLKENIRKIGSYKSLGVYLYNYIWSPKEHVGFMADEVAKALPSAVRQTPHGRMVNYPAVLEA